MVRGLCIVVLLAGAAAAQEKTEGAARMGRVFQIKYADVNQVARSVKPFAENYGMNWDSALRIITVQAPRNVLDTIEQAIKRIDVPEAAPKNIELTVYFMVASQQQLSMGVTVPDELESVTKQLGAVLAYKNFRLLDSLMMRCRDGQGVEASGAVPIVVEAPMSATTNVGIKSASVSADQVHVDGLRIGMRVPSNPKSTPNQWNYLDTGINTNIDIRQGQKVVAGKSNLNEPGQALVLVLSARVL